ncbi:MAG TPA: GNAT family N-acetyltransferase [Candidatus Limnocylindria bacterium]|nr:GNAT family N-acetyltransferase [Candidatus Limnocylindria bacterium]
MTLTVRNVRQDELFDFVDAISTSFLERPDVAKVVEEIRPYWDVGRIWAAFDGERMCGTYRTWASELSVPGGRQLPASAVTAVTVLPTHRRRGALRAMTAAEHAAIRQREEVFGLLYASEFTIYGRFGYGPACRQATWTLHTRDTGFLDSRPRGCVELVRPTEETRDQVKSLYEAWRVRQPGEMRRRDFRWDYDLGLRDPAWGEKWKGFLAFHRDEAGGLDGYARYSAKEKWVDRQPRNELIVNELHALNDEAYAGLWRFLGEVDLVATVKAEGRVPSERLPWLLTNNRAAVMSEVGEGLWVRIFDVPRALEARAYEREGRLVLGVVDREAASSPLRYELEVGAAGATCRPTDRSADLTIDVSALGAAYLGGTRLRDAVLASGWEAQRPGALAYADDLLRTADEPWCSTFF